MGKKLKQRAAHSVDGGLRYRVDVAVAEGRFQTALDLAKQLHKQEPTTEHRDLLTRIYLGRARQLRCQGKTRDATTVLRVAIPYLGDDQAKLAEVAQELAACGELTQALDVVRRLGDPALQARIMGLAADAAVRQEAAGRKTLPPDLHADFDRILQAFAQLEAGADDAARATLQDIGLQSPFLEWKLLLRGLLGYYLGEDARALENWQRLSPERLPASLIAPLRCTIDRHLQSAQSTGVQAALHERARRLQGSPLADRLRELASQLAEGEHLGRVFRAAESCLTQLRQQAPQLEPRLANLLEWTIIHRGQPEDILTYARIFGIPPGDPRLLRVEAIGSENHGELQEASRLWQAYEATVAAHPEAWPAGQAQRVRALIWCHLGENAAIVPPPEELAKLPESFRDLPGVDEPLEPPADQCFLRALELAPDLEQAHAMLLERYGRAEKHAEAEAVARQFLERRPDHLPTLQALAQICLVRGNFADGITFNERACRINPLDQHLRHALAHAHTLQARRFAESSQFDAARAEYQVALATDNASPAGVYCKWAACEFKAGNATRGEELLREAARTAESPLGVAYYVVIETSRLKLSRALKQRFEKEFDAGLAAPPTGAAAADLVGIAAAHRLAKVDYTGQKKHETKVFAYLRKARKAQFTEDQMVQVAEWLLRLERWGDFNEYAASGRRQFPQQPRFPLFQARALLRRGMGSARGLFNVPTWQVSDLLKHARDLAQRLPPSPQQVELLEQIERDFNGVDRFNPLMNAMAALLEGVGPEDDFDYDDDDEDDEEDRW